MAVSLNQVLTLSSEAAPLNMALAAMAVTMGEANDVPDA